VHIKHDQLQDISSNSHLTIDTIHQTQDAVIVIWVCQHYSRQAAWPTVILRYMKTRWKTLALATRNLIRWIKIKGINCWISIELIIYSTGNWLYACHSLLEAILDLEALGLSLHSLIANSYDWRSWILRFCLLEKRTQCRKLESFNKQLPIDYLQLRIAFLQLRGSSGGQTWNGGVREPLAPRWRRTCTAEPLTSMRCASAKVVRSAELQQNKKVQDRGELRCCVNQPSFTYKAVKRSQM